MGKITIIALVKEVRVKQTEILVQRQFQSNKFLKGKSKRIRN